jgi:hypothetical protein
LARSSASCAARSRLVAGKVALVRRVVDLDQRIARLHFRAGLKQDFGDAAVDVGRDVHLIDGSEIANRRQKIRQHFRLRLGHRHHGWRRFVVLEELRDHVRAEGIEAPDDTDQQHKRAADDDQPAPHAYRRPRLLGR